MGTLFAIIFLKDLVFIFLKYKKKKGRPPFLFSPLSTVIHKHGRLKFFLKKITKNPERRRLLYRGHHRRKESMEYTELPPDIIETDWSVLRRVRTETQDYIDLKESIRQGGVRAPILVRKVIGQDGDHYSLIDGRHRLTAALELDLKRIPCMVLSDCTDRDALVWQAHMNVQKVDTTPSELARHIQRLFSLDKSMTQAKAATLMGKTVAWVKKILDINSLPEEIINLVDQGQITLGNAILLVKAPESDRASLIESAKRETYESFEFIVNQKIKDRRQHKTDESGESQDWVPTPVRRKFLELEDAVAKVPKGVLNGVETAEEGFKQGVLFAMSLDDATVKARRSDRKKALKQQEAREAARKLQQKREEMEQLQEKLKQLENILDEQ